jgi:hypothetical protein
LLFALCSSLSFLSLSLSSLSLSSLSLSLPPKEERSATATHHTSTHTSTAETASLRTSTHPSARARERTDTHSSSKVHQFGGLKTAKRHSPLFSRSFAPPPRLEHASQPIRTSPSPWEAGLVRASQILWKEGRKEEGRGRRPLGAFFPSALLQTREDSHPPGTRAQHVVADLFRRQWRARSSLGRRSRRSGRKRREREPPKKQKWEEEGAARPSLSPSLREARAQPARAAIVRKRTLKPSKRARRLVERGVAPIVVCNDDGPVAERRRRAPPLPFPLIADRAAHKPSSPPQTHTTNKTKTDASTTLEPLVKKTLSTNLKKNPNNPTTAPR